MENKKFAMSFQNPNLSRVYVNRNMCDVVLWLVTDRREVALEEFSPLSPFMKRMNMIPFERIPLLTWQKPFLKQKIRWYISIRNMTHKWFVATKKLDIGSKHYFMMSLSME